MKTLYTTEEKQNWMRLLALSPTGMLERQLNMLERVPGYKFLKQPEVGLAMIQARACGNGKPFNFGEIPLTRCVVSMGGYTGYGYVSGRKKRHAVMMAVFDALLQDPEHHEDLQKSLLEPIAKKLEEKKQQKAQETGSTKVDFFTMVRGEDN
ncbi:alpha-D-ribose 1-methylphosphonate 5-triphosphate synthase subunit PhnG [Desulfocicer vacuolatum DSM 3385]|uniref:Alpha-D-ribose 1-methylphosphonate 5-triphosphate synthase subunit PhnG n=1 Tax=Desulfocicer vacuolatum DSM 3385 TaxID=1121400 RepID=A0A1W2ER83_9BACT|nr:phosphonate C-P lyase system protein PhnG [Desulfocicer vacuolatum]SMD12214.1 alpha-D-ribose 1-methylphosphonate 5-triphosphate synthase subunit PhnG [Desulfocicer vacuolatum DSM 3385]